MPDVIRVDMTDRLEGRLAGETAALLKATRRVIGRQTHALKRALRREVVRAGLGERLANAIRGVSDFKGETLFEGRVFSNAKYTPKSGTRHTVFDLILLYNQGTTIRPTGGRKYLAVPLKAAGRTGKRAAVPSDFARGSLVFVPSPEKGRVARLVRKSDGETVFLLLRSRVVPRRLSLAPHIAKALAGVEGLIVETWTVERARLAA